MLVEGVGGHGHLDPFPPAGDDRLAALAARSHWLTVEWLPKYAPEFNDIEVVWHDLKEAQVDLNRVRDRRRLLIPSSWSTPLRAAAHPQTTVLAHASGSRLGTRFRVLPIEIDKIGVHKIKDIFRPIPPESEEKLATILREKTSGWPRSRGMSGALYRDAKPRSAISTRLECSPSRTGHMKLNWPRKMLEINYHY
jgi:DDE superfamily endonuclease